TNAMRTIKELLQEEKISKDINILVIGRTGQGKSALINSLIELGKKIVPEGSKSARCTIKPQPYIYPNIIPGVNVTIIDSPGLQDTQNKEHKYIQEMKNECSEISLVLYCMKMTDHRFTNDDAVAIKKLHQVFGRKFWERVVFVLTFANRETLDMWDERDKDDENEEPDESNKKAWEELRKERLTGRVQLRKEKINTIVNDLLQLHDSEVHQGAIQKIKFEVLPAGYHISKHDSALSGVNWRHDLITLCCSAAKHKQILKLNK
uniref:AIG1-type G domain-containing protein n=1 Tax=Amphimedon queenslandica TaxID=400682 RepID=A0A1X7UL06_AMPQE